MMVLKYFHNVVLGTKLLLNKKLFSFSQSLKRIATVLVYITAIAWAAIFLYGTFYYYYLPEVSHVKPVHFHFRVCDNGVGICSFPTSNVTLVTEEQDEVFMPGQAYKIVLELDMPESQVNQHIGMFMVELTLVNRKDETVRVSARSALLHYRSGLLRMIETFVFSPFLLFGYMTQKQRLCVELFTNYIDNSYHPAVKAVVQVQSRAVEIYSADLKIFAEFSGIRYLLYYWPVTSAVIGISWNFILLGFIALLSWYNFGPANDAADKKGTAKDGGAGKKAAPKPETVGRRGLLEGRGDPEETTLLSPRPQPTDSGLRLRQPPPKS